MKIGRKNEILEERENHLAIYYDEKKKNYIESGRANKITNKCNLKGKLLFDYQKEFIEPIINNCPKLDNLLLENYEINEQTFARVFINFIFLSQIYIEYKIEMMNDNEIIEEF